MLDKNVPASVTRLLGHVCGVIAVAMAAASAFALWVFVIGLAHHRLSLWGAVLVAVCVGTTALFFRWAAVLTGCWHARGRLSVPPGVYTGIGLLCVATSLFGVYLLAVTPPQSAVASVMITFGSLSGAVLARWCFGLTGKRRE